MLTASRRHWLLVTSAIAILAFALLSLREAVSWYGHFSFYGNASPLGTFPITMNDSPAVKEALAPLAPRVLLVSTTSVLQ